MRLHRIPMFTLVSYRQQSIHELFPKYSIWFSSQSETLPGRDHPVHQKDYSTHLSDLNLGLLAQPKPRTENRHARTRSPNSGTRTKRTDILPLSLRSNGVLWYFRLIFYLPFLKVLTIKNILIICSYNVPRPSRKKRCVSTGGWDRDEGVRVTGRTQFE